MNAVKIITIICWIISAIVLAGLLIWVLTGTVFGSGLFWSDGIGNWSIGCSTENLTGPFESQGTQTADVANINSIKIGWVAGEITVIPHDGNEIQFTEYAQRSLRDNERLRMTTDGGTLNIRFRERNIIGNMPRKNLEVLVPFGLSVDMTRLDISTTSGSVKTEDFTADTVDISSVSADINIAKIVSQTIDISTTSGTITATDVRTGKLDTSSVSGAANITEAVATVLNTSTTSGRTNASGQFERIDVSSVSGGTIIRSETTPGTMSVSSVSGGIDIYIPNQGEITVNHSAVSGRFSSEIPVRIQNSAAYNFSSVSGNTNIYALG